jgi:hypothetical protein
VRAAQKQKLDLREEILRIRAERDQVALRLDSARAKHEVTSKEALVSACLMTLAFMDSKIVVTY